MPVFLVLFVNELAQFRIPELVSCAELYGATLKFDPKELEESKIFLRVEFPDEETAAKIISRCVLVTGVYEIWGESKSSIEDCATDVCNYIQKNQEKHSKYMGEDVSFRVDTNPFGKKHSGGEKVATIKKFSQVPILGKANMTTPQVEWVILERYEAYIPDKIENTTFHTLHEVVFTRKIGLGARHLIPMYDLRKREYIGTTSMDAALSFLVANQGLVTRGSYVMDPFVGTGSIIVSCAHFGGIVLGQDIDMRVLKGKNGKNIESNFKQYGLTTKAGLDVVRSDLAQNNAWRLNNVLDAIVCDPPYGIRAGAKKIGRKEVKEIPVERQATHIAASIAYDFDELLADLFNFAAKALRMGGRLVYWLPCQVGFNDSELYKHECFRLVASSGEQLTLKMQRRLITMEKIKEP